LERFVYSVKSIICILLGRFRNRALFTYDPNDEEGWNDAISVRIWDYHEVNGEFFGHDWEELTVCRGLKFRVSIITNGDT
jgi:hypothetical protein